jgi:hypothetical protein
MINSAFTCSLPQRGICKPTEYIFIRCVVTREGKDKTAKQTTQCKDTYTCTWWQNFFGVCFLCRLICWFRYPLSDDMHVRSACTHRKNNGSTESSVIANGRVRCLPSSREAAGSSTDLGDNYKICRFSMYRHKTVSFTCGTTVTSFQQLKSFENHEYYSCYLIFFVTDLLSFKFYKQSILYCSIVLFKLMLT